MPSVQAYRLHYASPVIYENASIFDCGVSIKKFKVYGLLIFGVVAMVAGSITAIVNAVSRTIAAIHLKPYRVKKAML